MYILSKFGLELYTYSIKWLPNSAEAGPVHDALVPRHRLQKEVDALLGHLGQFGEGVGNLGGDGTAVLRVVEGADGLNLQPDVGTSLIVWGLFMK